MKSKKKATVAKLSVLAVGLITISSVDSIRNLPGSAQLGSQAIFYFIAVAICYFIPIALVCAELSTTYPDNGGIYLWGKKTLGKHFGFLSLWFQFAENLVYYPPLLVFIIATGVFPISENLSSNNMLMFILINVIFWIVTFINIFGLKVSAIFTEIFATIGTVLPMVLICAVGIYWYNSPVEVNQIHITLKSIFPSFDQLNISVTFTTVVLSLTGMEIATVYAKEVKNPQKSYPKALMIATCFILLTLILGSLAIATVVGPANSTLNEGIMVFFTHFFEMIKIPWFIPIIAICIVCGGLAGLNNWIIAPIKGLHVAAQDGYLPKMLARENKYSAPVALLIIQGFIVTLLSLLFLFIPSVNEGMWLLNILMAVLYMVMYIFIFISFLASRILDTKINRPFKVPFGVFGMWFVFILGTFSSGVTILASFNPTAAVGITHYSTFIILLFIGFFIFTIPAIVAIIYQVKRTGK